jgi:hypothetical protein
VAWFRAALSKHERNLTAFFFLNMLKKEGCFFNVVLSGICIRFSDKTKTRLGAHRGDAWRVLLVLGRSQRGIL